MLQDGLSNNSGFEGEITYLIIITEANISLYQRC